MLVDLLKNIKVFIFDVDGTILLGNQALPFASEVIKLLQKNNLDFIILSNNSSYSIKENLSRIEQILNVKLEDKNLCTSTHATIDYLLSHNYRQCFILGTPGLVSDLRNNGIMNNTEKPQAIILGFDKTLTYEKIKTTALLLQKNKHIPFFATHPDDTCPTDEGEIPDVGSFLKMFEIATGRTADLIFGKPNKLMVELCLKRTNANLSEVLLIGDRLETDIKMANSIGINSALTLTGKSSLDEIEKKFKPTEVWVNLEFLFNYLKEI